MIIFAYLDKQQRCRGDGDLFSAEVPDDALPLLLGHCGQDGSLEPIVSINRITKTYRRQHGLERPFPEIWVDERSLRGTWTRVHHPREEAA